MEFDSNWRYHPQNECGKPSMTLTLHITDELQSKLEVEARKRNLELSEYVVRLLSDGSQGADRDVQTGADLVKYWRDQGVIGSRPEIADSLAHARGLRAAAEQRERD